MEENMSRSAIILAFSTLQFRLDQSSKHIKRCFNSIKLVYGQEGLDSISTIDSTLSSVRSASGKEGGQVELGKLLVRPDYARRAYSVHVRDTLVNDTTDGLRTEFYKVKVLTNAPLLNVPVQVLPDSTAQYSSVSNPLPHADSGANSHFRREVPPHIDHSRGVPASLSSVGRGSVSVLPGAGPIPMQWGTSKAATAAAAASGLPPVAEENLNQYIPDAAFGDYFLGAI
ncbi:hypothetical protein DFH08DRAFT_965381 [Mycena albidolilacea]|uniref:Uncharacterized protein n=1 Tax=Mycena albidolilacea TaxID=1033008 RepID=A0AAD6ZR27_9AGAR|nr:hypothetical protein DFH08DRAFT_965381 [Mycena albidolilacea]